MRKFTILLFFVAIAAFTYAQTLKKVPNAGKINQTLKLSTKHNKSLKSVKSIQSVDYLEDFQGTGSPTWTTANVDGNTDNSYVSGTIGLNFSAGFIALHFTGQTNVFAASNSWFTSAATANRWLFTPAITLTAANPTLSWKAQSLNVTTPAKYESYNVYVATSIAGSSPAPSDFTGSPVFTTTSEQNAALVTHSVNLTYTTGSTIYVAFRHVSNNCYFLALDDIRVGSNIVNDLVADTGYISNSMIGYCGGVPRTQVDNVYFGENIYNNGSAAQNNVTLAVNLNKNSSSVFTCTSAVYSSLASNANSTLTITSNYLPSSAGTGFDTYDADYYVSASGITDDNPLDNYDTVRFVVTDKIYSRCYTYTNSVSTANLSANGSGTNMIISDDFYFKNPDQIDSIFTAFVTGTTTSNVTVKGLLFSIDTITGNLTEVDSTNLHTVTSADIGYMLELNFISSYYPTAHERIRAGFRLNYSTSDTVVWLVDQSKYMTESAGMYYLPLATTPGWFYFTGGLAPYLELITLPGATNIKNIANSSNNINIYPNPTSGIIQITNAVNANVVVYNLLGEVVLNTVCTSLNSADLSTLPNGSYIVKVISDKSSITKKINIIK